MPRLLLPRPSAGKGRHGATSAWCSLGSGSLLPPHGAGSAAARRERGRYRRVTCYGWRSPSLPHIYLPATRRDWQLPSWTEVMSVDRRRGLCDTRRQATVALVCRRSMFAVPCRLSSSQSAGVVRISWSFNKDVSVYHLVIITGHCEVYMLDVMDPTSACTKLGHLATVAAMHRCTSANMLLGAYCLKATM